MSRAAAEVAAASETGPSRPLFQGSVLPMAADSRFRFRERKDRTQRASGETAGQAVDACYVTGLSSGKVSKVI